MKSIFNALIFVAAIGCATSPVSKVEAQVHPVMPVKATYTGMIASNSERIFTLVVDVEKKVTGTYSDGKHLYTIKGTVKDNTLEAFGTNGDFWGGYISKNTLAVVVKSKAGNFAGKGTLLPAN